MRSSNRAGIVGIILIVTLISFAAFAESSPPPAKAAVPGAELAKAISTVTGVAISPLLGASAVGAWQYVEAKTPEKRAALPWFAQPWFWVPALLIVGLCGLKDTFGIVVPTVLKKPFDVLETAEHKVSGMIMAGTFVPMVASVFHEAGLKGPTAWTAHHGFFAMMDFSWLYNCISVPVLLAAYVVVFLAGNAINILILLSPFTTVDAGLKAFRLFMLSTVTVTAFIHPYVGAVWALILIAIAYFIAGWSFRLSHFGLSFIWDFFTVRRARFVPDASANWMFLGRKTDGVPIRSYGKLSRDAEGRLTFDYRPWLVFPPRKLNLPAGGYSVGKGLIYSEIIRVEGEHASTAMVLPPRYRSHEAELSAVYSFMGVREVGLLAAFAWLKEWLGFKRTGEAAGG